MSLDEVVMDLSDVFEFGQGYVALSRVRRLSGLHLLGWNKRTFEVHPDVLARDEQFHEVSEEAAEAFDKISADELQKMQENFIKACGGRLEASVHKPEAVSDGTGKLAKIREKYPNAYRPWDETLDKQLTKLFESGVSPREISKSFGRQNGSIRARLIKLGLIAEAS